VIRVKNTRTGKTVEVRPTAQLLELLASLKSAPKKAAPQGQEGKHEHAAPSPGEALARKIAAMPEGELAEVRVVVP
jgi:hypothetical protein